MPPRSLFGNELGELGEDDAVLLGVVGAAAQRDSRDSELLEPHRPFRFA